MNINEIASSQTDATLELMLMTYGGRSVRDGQGNLRELNPAEVALGQALRSEAKRRGLR